MAKIWSGWNLIFTKIPVLSKLSVSLVCRLEKFIISSEKMCLLNGTKSIKPVFNAVWCHGLRRGNSSQLRHIIEKICLPTPCLISYKAIMRSLVTLSLTGSENTSIREMHPGGWCKQIESLLPRYIRCVDRFHDDPSRKSRLLKTDNQKKF